MSVQDVTAAIQALVGVGTLVFAFLGWWKARAANETVKQTHELVNGASIIRIDAAYAKGAKDQRQDIRDAADLAREAAAGQVSAPRPPDPPAV